MISSTPASLGAGLINRRGFLRSVGVGATGTLLSSRLLAQMSANKEEQVHDGTWYSAPPVAFDPVMGFRWMRGPIRMIRIINSELVMDGTLSGNNYGYNCSYDFTPKKPSPRTFRFVVLGDSYTAGIYSPRPWPEQFQQLLRSRVDREREVQVYPFPIDGGGLVNWHSVFMNQMLADFEFDALIIPSWFDDLARDFIVCDSDQKGMYIRTFPYDEQPKSRKAFEKIRPTMAKHYEIVSTPQIKQIVDQVRQSVRPRHVTPEYYNDELPKSAELAPPGYVFSDDVFIQRYSRKRLTLLTEIVRTCQDRHVPVIFCAVPTRPGVLRMLRGSGTLLHRAETEGLCKHFGISYFDGYGIFGGIDAQAIVDLYWVKYDLHWGLPASDLFALKLAEWVTGQGTISA